jgi:DNA-binding MarR family transcriptional regulator
MDALDELVTELRRLFFTLRGVTDELLGDLDCSAPERSLLQELHKRGPQPVPALARTRAITRQAMQRVVDHLLARRWLRALPNPAHERSPLIGLAPAGEKTFAEIRQRELRLLTERGLPVAGTELRRTAQTLRALADHFAGHQVPAPRTPYDVRAAQKGRAR